MAPPAGTSSMLRARRRDATLKPNRTLDRNASRGMLYENEELRLRTININAEVEKGQNYIKKLRRENEQLKKEIWNLREEYDRLENYVKSREQSENEEDDSCMEEPSTAEDVMIMSSLETVVEEDVGVDESIVDGNDAEPIADQHSTIAGAVCGESESDSSRHNPDAVAADDGQRDVTDAVSSGSAVGCGDLQEGRVAVTAADAVAAVVGRGADDREHEAGDNVEQLVLATDSGADPGADGHDVTNHPRESLAAHQDATMTLPHTACFDTGNNRQLHDLTVDEVIDAVQVAELRDKLRSVCVTDDRCYMTFASAEHLERALHTTFRIRDVPVLLMDTGTGAVILSLTGVPDTVTDKDVLKCLKKYGTIVGGVERKTARCGATGGERYVRVRPTLGAPRYLWFGSDKVIVRQLTEHETGTMNSVARRKSFRSQIKLNLKMIDPSTCPPSPSAGRGESSGRTRTNGDGDGAAAGDGRTVSDTAVSAKTGFRFSTADPKTGGAGSTNPAPEPCKTMAAAPSSAPVKLTGSPKRSTKVTQNDRDGCPQTPVPASGPAESPLRGRRRPSVMQGVFRRDTITKHRGGSMSRAEDADSDTSTICRRKLSITGRERAEKVPWCGCWGNGCL